MTKPEIRIKPEARTENPVLLRPDFSDLRESAAPTLIGRTPAGIISRFSPPGGKAKKWQGGYDAEASSWRQVQDRMRCRP